MCPMSKLACFVACELRRRQGPREHAGRRLKRREKLASACVAWPRTSAKRPELTADPQASDQIRQTPVRGGATVRTELTVSWGMRSINN